MGKKVLRNYMEEVVSNLLDSSLKDLDICKCERCKVDIMAISLNELPPKYVVTTKGVCYTQLNHVNPQFETDIVAAIIKAASKVAQKPNHDTNQ